MTTTPERYPPIADPATSVRSCFCLARWMGQSRELTALVIAAGWRVGLPVCEPRCRGAA
jgi:hypothetical protein